MLRYEVLMNNTSIHP